MKTAALVLALLVGATQSLIAADCCCVIVCKHHSEVCSTCAHQSAPAPEKKDCCDKKSSAPAAPESPKRCVHVEPSSEVTIQAADAVAAPPTLVLDLPPDPAPAAGNSADAVDLPALTERGSPPLYLLHSVLLI